MSAWQEGYKQCDEKPAEVDTTSSKKWVYVRKNIHFVKGDDIVVDHWEFLERKIDKEDWDIFCDVQKQEITIDDIIDGMIELAGLITGGD